MNLFWNNFYQWEIIGHNIDKSVSVQMHSTSGSHHQNHRQKNSLCYCPKNWLHLVFVWSRLCCALCCCGHHFLHFVNCCSFTNFWSIGKYQIERTFSNIFDPSHYCSTNECQLMSVKFPMHNDRKLFSFPWGGNTKIQFKN